MKRYALGYMSEDRSKISVDICPFCTGPHEHRVQRPVDAMNWGMYRPDCGHGRKYTVVDGNKVGVAVG